MLLFILAQAAAAAAPVAPSSAPAQPAPGPAAQQAGVTSYPPEFFAEAHPNTANDMIGFLPGFIFDSGSDVRGYEGAAGNVLINGQRPVTKTDNLNTLLARILASQVARIDVIRGGAPGIDMQGKTVIANVITKQQGGTRFLIHYADQHDSDGRRFGFIRLEGSGQAGKRTWEGGLDLGGFVDDGYGDGPRTITNGDGGARLLGHIHAQGWGTQMALTGATEAPLGEGRLRINGRLYSQDYDTAELDTTQFPDSHTEHDHQDDNKGQSEVGLDYTRPLSGRVGLEIVALRQDARERYADTFDTPTDAQLFKQDTDSSETILRGVLKFQQRPSLSWEAGAEGAYNSLENHLKFSDNGVFQAIPAADVMVDEKRGEVFLKSTWRPFSTISVEGALREEGSQIESSGDVALSKTLYYTKPRVLLTWSPDADTQVRLRYEREVGQLDFNSFVASTTLAAGVVTAGNPNLVPSQDWASEIAIERHFWGSGGVTLTARHLQITDVIDRAPIFVPGGQPFDAPANIGDGTEDDFLANITLPLDKLGLKGAQIRGDWTRRVSQVIDPTTHRPRGISGQHPTDWDLHFSQPIGHVSYGVDLSGGWQQRYYRFNQIEIDKLQTYVTPFWEWKPNPKFSFRIEIDNVTARPFKHVYENWDGPRGAAPLNNVEQRTYKPGRVFYFRVRKVFGN
ncbi:MAG: TonB-dependent receptor [Proteobacteria bacterium]|nr:TonB-dependent receptor [Pseudomonadota bacterium]